MKGFISLHRSLLENPVFAHQTALKIWIWLLLKASHKKRFVPIKVGKGEAIVTINVGEILFGRLKAEEELGIDGSTIYKWIKKFEEQFEMISIKSSSHYSVITIVNWEEYQAKEENGSSNVAAIEQQSSSNVTYKEQHCNTDNNVNNVNKETNSQNLKIQFEEFRVLYPGTKRGLNTEFQQIKKHSDYKEIIPTLKETIQKHIKHRSHLNKIGEFVPQWKNLQTWINQRCWEEEIPQSTTYSQNGDSIEIEPGIEYIDKNIYKYPWHKNKKTQMWIKGHPYAATNQAEPQYADGMGRFITKEQFELLTKKEKL